MIKRLNIVIVLAFFLLARDVFLVCIYLIFYFFVSKAYFNIFIFLFSKFIKLFKFVPGFVLASNLDERDRRIAQTSLSAYSFALVIVVPLYAVKIVPRVIYFESLWLNLLFRILSSTTRAVLSTIKRSWTSAIISFQSKLAVDDMVINVVLNHYVCIRFHWFTWSLSNILILSFKSKIIVFVSMKCIKLAFLKFVLRFFILFFCCFLVKSIFRFWFVFLSFLL